MMSPIDRLVDLDAERAVLGSCLLDPDAMGIIEPHVTASDFHEEKHRWIFEAMRELQEQRIPADIITISERANGKAANVRAYLLELLNATPSALRVAHYAKVVRRLATLRRLLDAGGKIAALAYSSDSDELDDVFSRARQMVDNIAPEPSDDSVLYWLDSLDAFLGNQLDRLGERDAIAQGTATPPVTLPWQAFAQFGARLRPGTLSIVAAGSSVGKTTFLECCAEHWARQGHRVVFFHLELSHQMMLDRRMVRLTGLPLERIENGEMPPEVHSANERLRQYTGGITYVHCPGWSASRIVQQARQLSLRAICDVVIVDYLQKLRLIYRRGSNKSDAIGSAVEVLKVAAEKLAIPFVLASQFNRSVMHAGRKTGDYIRGSGEPHEKANLVITLDRPILSDDARDPTGRIIAREGERSPEMRVRVDKNTNGPTGDTELIMNAARFLILDKAHERGEVL